MENIPRSVPQDARSSAASAPLAEQVKDQAQQIVQQIPQRAGQLAAQARDQVKSQLTTQKERAAESMGSVAQAVRQTGQHLREHDQAVVGSYADTLAEQVERFSGYLKKTDIDGMVGETTRFARSRPALFLGGAFVLGLLAARFLKSSAPEGNGMEAGSLSVSRYPLGTTHDQPWR